MNLYKKPLSINLISIAITILTVCLPEPSTAIEVYVSESSGSAITQVPIEVPSGRNGLQPKVTLSYTSSGGNNWLGVGWDIETMDIQRSTKRGIDYSSHDYIANGRELVPVSVDTSGNGEYAERVESSFTKYEFNEFTGWIATTTGGTKYYYGTSQASQQVYYGSSGTAPHDIVNVFKWCLNKVEDTNNNSIIFNYTKHQNEIYLDRIDYNGHYVKFYLEDRLDVSDSMATRYNVRMSKRLKSIDVHSCSGRVRSYEVSYGKEESTGRSLLTSIRIFGADSTVDSFGAITSGSIINTITCDWPSGNVFDFTSVYSDNGIGGHPINNKSDRILPFDYNGDGFQDLFIYRPGSDNNSIVNSKENENFNNLWGRTTIYIGANDKVFSFDYNGDGDEDLFFYRPGSGKVIIAHSNGDGSFNNVYSSENSGIAGYNLDNVNDIVFPFDYNGDGLQDLFLYRPGTGKVSVARSNGNGTYTAVYANNNSGIAGFDLKNVNDSVFPFDYNGDGHQDLFLYRPGVGKVSIARSNGNGSFTSVYSNANSGIAGFDFKNTNDKAYAFDYNGDGLQDLFFIRPGAIARVACSVGDGFFLNTYQNKNYMNSYGFSKVSLLDYNGDGLGDVLLYNPGSGKAMVLRSCGSFFYTILFEDGFDQFDLSDINDQILTFDYNGNGIDDLLLYRPGSGLVSVVRSFGTERSDLISEINLRSGARYQFNYRPSSFYSNKKLPFIIQTVSSLVADDGDGLNPPITREFSYAGGDYDYIEKRFLGFETVTCKTLNPNTTTLGTKIETTYHQEKNLVGLEKRIEAFPHNGGNQLSSITKNWDDSESLNADSERVFVKLTSKTITTYENGGETTTRHGYTYDNTNGFILTESTSGDGADDVVEKKEYENFGDWAWRLVKETLEDQTGTIFRQVDYDYFMTTGNKHWQKAWLDGASEADQPTVSFGYDLYGNITTLTDAMGNTTFTEYDSTTNTFPVKIISPTTGNGVNHVVEYLDYDYRFGKPTKIKDENGNVSEFFFDEFGRTTRVDAPDGGQVVTIFYDDLFPRKVITMVNEKDTGANKWTEGYDGQDGYEGCIGRGRDSYTYFDGLDRVIQNTTIGENGQPVIVKTLYNHMGQAYKSVGPFFGTSTDYYPGDGPSDCPYTQTVFDNRGRVVSMTSPDTTYGTVTALMEYNGLSITSVDPDGKRKTEKKNYLGQLVEVIEHGLNNIQFHTYYNYNIAGDLLSVVDHLGHVTSITYDSLGRKTSMTDPNMGYWQYPEYDKNGNLKQQIDANETVITMDYDELNRLIRKSYSTSQHPVGYTYDTAIENGIGRLHSIDNGNTVIRSNSYDSMGRLISQTKVINGTDYTTQFSFDLAGKTKTMVYPDNYILSYQYDEQNGLLRNTFGISDFKNYAAFLDYNAAGQVGKVTYGNDTSTRYTYDPKSQKLVGYHNGFFDIDTPANNRDYQYKEYTYSPAGDILSIDDKLKSNIKGYTYDNLHRLTGEKLPGAQTTHQDVLSYTYDTNRPHAVSQIIKNGTPYDFIYDNNGSMTNGYDFSKPNDVAPRSIVYNAENMPVSILRNDVETILEYDGIGSRTKKTSGGNSTLYIGDHYEVRNGTPIKYIFGGGQRIAKVVSDTVFYYHKDHLGSSVLLTDENGQAVSNSASGYTPFGMDREPMGFDVKSHKFTDQEYDSEAGLYNYNARLYDPAIGVFISADTMVPNFANPQNLNRYTYCNNNPLIYTDPTGHWSLKRTWRRIEKEFKRSLRKANDEIDRFCKKYNVEINAYAEGSVDFGEGSGGNRSHGSSNGGSEDAYVLGEIYLPSLSLVSACNYDAAIAYLNYIDGLRSRGFIINSDPYTGGFVAYNSVYLSASALGFGFGGDAYLIYGIGGTIGATSQRYWGSGFDGGEMVTSFQGPLAIGRGFAATGFIVATLSPKGDKSVITGASTTIGVSGGPYLQKFGVSLDFPHTGRGFWDSVINVSISVSWGFGFGQTAYATTSYAVGEPR
ncbi:hypothetical protein JCM14469_24290 [Desulfatiferula olefinivorans]